MNQHIFIPYREIHQHDQVLVVDSYHAKGTMLSHWRGAQQDPLLQDDTSTGIVLNAIRLGYPALKIPPVTNNHWDIDGFLGIWALFQPEKAMENEAALREAALIGDFREYQPSRPGADLALKMVCWFNANEKELFYAPFDSEKSLSGPGKEADACVAKYTFFLDAFNVFLADTEAEKSKWLPEYQQVNEEVAELAGKRHFYPDIRLMVVYAPRPMHYYALFSDSENSDMVLTCYPENRYELEYKYTSWVDTATRKSFPRIALQGLAGYLSRIDTIPWEADSIMDTGPMLRPQASPLDKSARYASPFSRNHWSGSLDAQQVEAVIVAFFRKRLPLLYSQPVWTWKEIRACNEKVKDIPFD